tara:strand:+ start:2723 stop:3037 length:315 start_codon:yes stop_codon:yes gene_type:complete
MTDNNDQVHIDEQQVSGGSKEGVVRWVLGIGLVLAIVAMSVIWIVPAMMQGEAEEDISSRSGAPAETMEMEGDDTDGIVTEQDLGDEGFSEEPATDAGVETTEN